MQRRLTHKFFYLLIATLAAVNGVYASDEPITLKFETSPYGLIFTAIEVNGEPLLAMVDIGDQQRLQVAFSTAEALAIPLEKAGFKAGDINGKQWDVYQGTLNTLELGEQVFSDVRFSSINGKQWDVYQGTLNTLELGEQVFSDVRFSSSRGDIEDVAKQISTDFEAVIGWGFLQDYIVEFDYSNKLIRMYEQLPQGLLPTMTLAYEDQYGPLILEVMLEGKVQRVMLDTGASVSVFDPQLVKFGKDNEVSFNLSGEAITLTGYEQDLAVLADLEVVGILGSDLLHLYKVIINPFSHQMHFVKFD
ncbi:MAG: hypothetical protein CBB67_021205 [Alteromonadaceae bacterium TMED7]|nr:hypothetical protein [Alteromonadaceae bacterium]MCP4865066.1 hypothetical protein [Alteromonas sp.]RPH13259.1 MAG: hypothetical protein CBB67_021205 [Alteromonadaceae bacterium TMED7]